MNKRLKLTEQEKMAQTVLGTDNEHVNFNMSEGNIEEVFEKEHKRKFNDEVDKYVDKLDKHQELLNEYAESFKDNIGTIEIKPLFSRVLIKPFKHNPFQRIKIENGIIVDTGGLTPEHFNTDTGEIEEDKQDIVVGVVVDAGTKCEYLKESDVVFYRQPAAIPVPFFKQGLYCVSENQIIAVVNEGLTERFSK
jgi:hypothetical protein